MFEPDEGGGLPAPIRVEEIAVYPDLEALLLGDIQPKRIELSGVSVEFWLDGEGGGRGHWPWLERAVRGWQRGGGGVGGEGGRGSAGVGAGEFPEIVFHDGEVLLRSPAKSMPEVSLRLDELRVFKRGPQLLMDGGIALDGAGYALLSAGADLKNAQAGVALQLQGATPDLMALPGARERVAPYLGKNSKLSLRGAELSWPPALILHEIQLTDTLLRIPGQDSAHIESLGAQRVEIAFDQDLIQIRIIELNAQAKLQWINNTFSARLPLSLPSLEVGIDFARKRIGMGFDIQRPNDSWLRVAAAYDVDARDLALDLSAQHFDAGSLLSLMPYAGPITVSEGQLDGRLGMRYLIGDGLLQLQSDLGVSGVALSASWLSEQPMSGLRLRFKGDATLDLLQRTITLQDGLMILGDLAMSISGQIQRVGEGRDIQLRANIQANNLSAASLLPSLPTGFAPALAGYQLQGTFSLGLDLDLDTRHPDQMRFDPLFDMSHVEVLAFGPLANIPLLAGDDFAIKINTSDPPKVIGPTQPHWTPFSAIPDTLLMSLTAAEDNRFFQHHGFDLKAIRNSLIANFEAGDIVRGGSTITQQLAKNLFLSQKKTAARKLQESFLTWQLEQHLSKRRILELYLNMVHWGPSIYGLHAAAQHYFSLPPGQLSLRESIFLCAILPNPARFGEHYAQGFVQADRLQKMQNILSILRQRDLIPEDEFTQTRARLSKAQISKRPRPAPQTPKVSTVSTLNSVEIPIKPLN